MSGTGWVPDAAQAAAPPPAASSGWVPDPPAQRSWLDSATDFAKGVWQQVNPVSGVKGAAQLAAHPLQTYETDASNRQELLNQAEAAFKKGNYGEGMAHALYGIIPFLGPQMDQAGTNIGTGKTAEGLGQSVGMGLNVSAPAVVGAAGKALGSVPGVGTAADALSRRMYQTSMKPSTTLGPTRVGQIVDTGLTNEIPISEGGLSKLNDLVSDLNSKVQAKIQAGSNAGATVNKFDVTSRLNPTATRFATQANPEADMAAIANSGNEFLRNQPNEIPAADAQAVKSGTYKQLSSKAYGELDSAAVESQKALARGIKEELETQFPEIKGLNADEGKLLGLQPVLERAVSRINNRDILSLGGKIISTGAGGAIGALSGNPEGAAIGSAGALALHYVMTDPVIQSRLAFALQRASKGTLPAGAAQARVGAYVSALGNVANSGTSADQGSQ